MSPVLVAVRRRCRAWSCAESVEAIEMFASLQAAVMPDPPEFLGPPPESCEVPSGVHLSGVVGSELGLMTGVLVCHVHWPRLPTPDPPDVRTQPPQ